MIHSSAIWFLVISAVIGLPLILGPAITQYEIRRNARLLKTLLKEADAHGVSDEPEFEHVVFCFVGFLTMAPRWGSGHMPRKSRNNELHLTLQPFLEQNQWIVPFLMSPLLSYSILAFIGRPWLLKRWIPALFAWMVFRSFTNKDGTVKIVFEPSSYQGIMKDLPEVDPRMSRPRNSPVPTA